MPAGGLVTHLWPQGKSICSPISPKPALAWTLNTLRFCWDVLTEVVNGLDTTVVKLDFRIAWWIEHCLQWTGIWAVTQ